LRAARLICAAGLCLLLGACADSARDGPETYAVEPGDSLYSIAWRHNLDYRDLARWNNSGTDFRISIGQVLLLGPGAPAREVQPAPSTPTAATWVWPTQRSGAPRPVPGGGILVPGRLGQEVRAASAGRVVYTGSGLRGYGNLIIVKHADNLLSAYAHNREMQVHEGQELAAGQVIAHMGVDAQQAPNLYFEIRQNGRPVNPLAFLSREK
jgi:lipoprotein NlpD